MGAIDTKVLRDIWRMRMQLFAIAAVVAAGSGLFLGMRTTMRSLQSAQADYYARERFATSQIIDEERIIAAIEMTRFPVPDDPAYAETDSEAALVRAADLIGQLADPFYHRKINALYAEMCETGVAKACHYESAADMADKYPEFFAKEVAPYIGPALGYLELTTEGKQWIANLDSNLSQVEHRLRRIGPFPGASED